MDDTIISDVRAFNRFYTRQIGVLDEHMVQSPFSLAEGRVLYEIASRGHTTASNLVKALNLDPAYLSRILRKFVTQDLTSLSPSHDDRRSNQVALTREGDEAMAELDAASAAAVANLLAPLGETQRTALVSAMRTIRQVLGDDLPLAPIVLRPHRVGELGWLVHRQGILYQQQFGWNGDFEVLIAKIYHDFAAAPETPPKNLWVAERAGTVIGSVFVVPSEGRPGTAQLRMLYVEPEARGAGLGTTLVQQSISFAREAGYSHLRLWTQSVLEAARKIYATAGFECVETSAHRSFGKDLLGEHWERAL